METPADQEALPKPDPARELITLAERPSEEAQCEVLPPHLQTLVDVHPEMRATLKGFTVGNIEQEQRKFLGLLVEYFCSYDPETRERRVTDEEFDAILKISAMPGCSFIHRLIADIRKSAEARALGEEKPPIEQRVIREIPAPSASSAGSTPIRCGNEAILEIRA